ncbi:MAG: YkgJ family cysteine cluster protein [Candidatus Latescibacteria bacterium]|nr:YkgJ family cysteine cluster protein [Candidatus Latescibacterota bacterium]
MPTVDAIFLDYRAVAGLVEQEFDRNLRLYGDRIQCGRGCSSCCGQMFRITLVDAAILSRAVKQLAPEARAALQSKARTYLKERTRLIQERAREMERDDDREVPTTGLRLPCPALDGNACSLYESRPLVCRKWGIPLYDPHHPDTLQACELNFPPGTVIEDDDLIERQTEIAERWGALKQAMTAYMTPGRTATTIAEAMLFDYDEMLTARRSVPKALT